MRFLVVDDSATMRRIVVNALRRMGWADTVEAADGAEALARFDHSIGFVITDWNMPHVGGLELVRTLRSRPHGRDVPVLVLAGRELDRDILEAARAGVGHYVVKPFTPEILIEQVERVLGARRGAA